MRSGTSNCHVRISREPVDSPVVTRPTVLIAMNEPSLRKFLPDVEPLGVVLYNGAAAPEDCRRPDVRLVAIPFTEMADRIGSSKVANIAMLGALLEMTDMLDHDRVVEALRRMVKSPKFFELDLEALARGREAGTHL
jgi:Pyruvate/2-oxoacid:ferredoxin oxidoreductase gamma subunit